jgi:hypothetical protein
MWPLTAILYLICLLSTDLSRDIAQAVSRTLAVSAAQFPAQVSLCGICGGQNGTEAGFLRVLRFPLPLIPPTAHSSPSSIIRGWYNRPISGRHIDWTHPTPRHPPPPQRKTELPTDLTCEFRI